MQSASNDTHTNVRMLIYNSWTQNLEQWKVKQIT